MNDTRSYSVETKDGSEATLWSDDTFTLHFGAGFDDECESTPEMLAEAVAAHSLVDISNSRDGNDSSKATAALRRIAEAEAIAGAQEEWPGEAICEYIEAHDENDKIPDEQLLAMFRAVYGRSPEGREERIDMWSHICAGVSHS